MSWRSRVVDVSLGAAVVYLGVWLYELCNLAVLSAAGTDATMTFVGILPVGVSAVDPNPQLLALAKPVQVLLAGGAMLVLLRWVHSRSLPISNAVVSATLSIYVASFYWEMLSLAGPSSYALHMGGFTFLALATQLLVSRATRVRSESY